MYEEAEVGVEGEMAAVGDGQRPGPSSRYKDGDGFRWARFEMLAIHIEGHAHGARVVAISADSLHPPPTTQWCGVRAECEGSERPLSIVSPCLMWWWWWWWCWSVVVVTHLTKCVHA
jgi:hypothetical protein